MKKAIAFLFVALFLATTATAYVFDDEDGKTTIYNPEQQGYGSHRSLMIKQIVQSVDNGDGAGIGFYLSRPMSYLNTTYFADYWLGDIFVDNVYCGKFNSCARIAFNVNTDNGAERALVIDGSTRTITIKNGWTLVYER